MNETIPFISMLVVIIGLLFTLSRNYKIKSIGWLIATIGMSINAAHCFYLGRMVLCCINGVAVIIDGFLTIFFYRLYKQDCLEKRERFLNEIMNNRKKYK